MKLRVDFELRDDDLHGVNGILGMAGGVLVTKWDGQRFTARHQADVARDTIEWFVKHCLYNLVCVTNKEWQDRWAVAIEQLARLVVENMEEQAAKTADDDADTPVESATAAGVFCGQQAEFATTYDVTEAVRARVAQLLKVTLPTGQTGQPCCDGNG